MKRVILAVLFLAAFSSHQALAQVPCQAEAAEYPSTPSCPTESQPWTTSNIPFVDAVPTQGQWPSYGDNYGDIVSLYGSYGNIEQTSVVQAVQNHYNTGITLGGQVIPLCKDGHNYTNNYSCDDGSTPAIVMLVLGFSNCELEVCGGNEDIWQWETNPIPPALPGQTCATNFGGCPNLGNPAGAPPYNAYATNDTMLQASFLYQVYSPTQHLVGQHVVIFNGAAGAQTLDHWDISGFFTSHACNLTGIVGIDPECGYKAAMQQLNTNGYSEAQVQVIYFKSANAGPQCDLKMQWCNPDLQNPVPNAFIEEKYLGDILRYLKCCKVGTNNPRYPNLKQVFLTTRIYGGYANGTGGHGCLSPEPYAYEEGFAVQRAIVAQINGTPDSNGYSGALDNSVAPWFDWGPYLWANGVIKRNDGLNWCGGQNINGCNNNWDVRDGDLLNEAQYWGDYTHPTATGATKAATQMVTFFTKTTGNGGSPFVQHWNQQ